MSGVYTPGLPAATLPLTGNETIGVDTNLTQGAYPETEAITLSQLATLMGGNLPLSASRFYGLPPGATPGTLLTVTATLYAYPFYIPAAILIKTIGMYTTTGQTGGAAHVGIYKDNGVGYPGALVSGTDGAALICTSGAAAQTNTINVTLQAGWYWLASIFTASGTFPTVADITAVYPTDLNAQLGSDTAAHLIATSGQAATGISVAGTYGALPTTFTAAATLTLNAGTPLVQLGT